MGDTERHLSFDLRDFDETLAGPFEWDVMRMVASLQVLARDQGLDDAEAADRAVSPPSTVPDPDRPLCGRPARHLVRTITSRICSASSSSTGSARTSPPGSRSEPGNGPTPAREEVHRSGRRSLRLAEAPPFRVRDDRADRDIVEEVFAAYRSSLSEDRRYLLDRYSFVDVVRQVVGVGSVGMRVYLVLLQGSRPDDLCLLQIKQAGPSVYEAVLAPSPYPNHGQRVTVGRRFIQSATDIFVGWTSTAGIDFYVRQFRDMKVIPSGEQVTPRLRQFARKCGVVLARAHATTGDAAAIDAYLGKGANLRRRHGRVRSGLRPTEPPRPRPARRSHT